MEGSESLQVSQSHCCALYWAGTALPPKVELGSKPKGTRLLPTELSPQQMEETGRLYHIVQLMPENQTGVIHLFLIHERCGRHLL